jgi:hypothetical protein
MISLVARSLHLADLKPGSKSLHLMAGPPMKDRRALSTVKGGYRMRRYSTVTRFIVSGSDRNMSLSISQEIRQPDS